MSTRKWKKMWGFSMKNKKIWDWIIQKFSSKTFNNNFSFCMYKMSDSFALFTAEAWKKNDVKVIEYGGEI